MRPKYITIKEDKNAALFIYFMIYTTTIAENDGVKKNERKAKIFISLNSSVEFWLNHGKLPMCIPISYENTHIFGWYAHINIIVLGMFAVRMFCCI